MQHQRSLKLPYQNNICNIYNQNIFRLFLSTGQ